MSETNVLTLPGPKALLELSDGTQWPGFSFGARVHAVGEAVFSTSMTGYPGMYHYSSDSGI